MAKSSLLERYDPTASVPGSRSHKMAAAAASNPRLSQLVTLELNADMRPVWYFPLSTVNWADVIWWIAKGEQTGIPRINVVDYYPGVYVSTGTKKYQLPSVVSHRKMVPMPKRVAMTRFNLLLRDGFKCQYTGEKLPPSELNFDHVIPKSQGGQNTWENLVACNKRINTFKKDKRPEQCGLKLIRQPYEPTPWGLYELGRAYPPNFLHESWSDFLFWDARLEPQYTSYSDGDSEK